jgi:hypothetical protein
MARRIDLQEPQRRRRVLLSALAGFVGLLAAAVALAGCGSPAQTAGSVTDPATVATQEPGITEPTLATTASLVAPTQPAPDPLLDQVPPVGLPETPNWHLAGPVTVVGEVPAFRPPAQLPLYEIVPVAPVTRASMDVLADQFGFGPEREYGEGDDAWLRGSGGTLRFPRMDDAWCYTLSGGGGQSESQMFWPVEEIPADEAQTPATAPPPDETRAIADAFLAQWGLAGEFVFVETCEAEAWGTATLGGEEERRVTQRGVLYTVNVGGAPLVGPGAYVSVNVGVEGDVVSFCHYVEKVVESEQAVTIRPLEDALADLRAGIGQPSADANLESAGSLTIESIELCYYAAHPRSAEPYYKPVYVFHVRGSDGSLFEWLISAFEGNGEEPLTPPTTCA